MKPRILVATVATLTACRGGAPTGPAQGTTETKAPQGTTTAATAQGTTTAATAETTGAPGKARPPLVLVRDVPLPGGATRFDYQDIDPARGHLFIAHMNDASVVVANLSDGAAVKVLPGIPRARGVVVAADIGRVFVTSSPNKVVVIDAVSLEIKRRVDTGTAPDGIAWDPVDKTVAVSDQGDGAVSLLRNEGEGARETVPLGKETGNVIFDGPRRRLWVTVVSASPPDQLVAIDPVAAKVVTRIPLPGCSGAHGLRLTPDGSSALVACEDNDVLARVDLAGTAPIVTAKTGAGPDVLSVDPGLGWLYVAAESGPLTVFDIGKPGLTKIDEERLGDNAHSVAVDPATHQVYFPLQRGPDGTPVLRVMRPSGS
ncbi:MAG: YncE family protein [Polyangiaceae bacterium]